MEIIPIPANTYLHTSHLSESHTHKDVNLPLSSALFACGRGGMAVDETNRVFSPCSLAEEL